jgi:hypothetical protein
MAKELSPVEKCKKNNWKKGTILRSIKFEMGNCYYEYWKITGFGQYEVLGYRTHLKPFETSGEEIIQFHLRDKWRKCKK